jgi:uracil-DNA glycosylase
MVTPKEPDIGPRGTTLDSLLADIHRCRRCRDNPVGAPLPHEPRPVLRAAASAKVALCGQAPGTRVHRSGVPFDDASGIRLRDWLGIDATTFYDTSRIAIVPMGFCFPGQDSNGSDRPPRRECAPMWRARVFTELPALEMIILIGRYAQAWHLGTDQAATVTETVSDWQRILDRPGRPAMLPLPHPSWRNNGWISRHSWFSAELLPALKRRVNFLTQKDNHPTGQSGGLAP